MKYLITGGAGFIGSHLCEALLNQGHAVHVLDDLSTGALANLEAVRGHERFRHTVGSVTDPVIVEEAVAEADAVYHLAAAVGVRLIVEKPVETIETNLKGTDVVLTAARRRQTRVLITSTSEVYGKSEQVPFREDQDLLIGPPTKARWSYACSKAVDEFLAFAHARDGGLPIVIARLFNTVGPRQTGRYGMVLPSFVRQALAEEPITIFGDGLQTRCFCHVYDTTRCLVELMSRPAAEGEIVNVGNDAEISIEGLARLVKERTGSSSTIVKIPYEEAYAEGFEDMRRRVPALDKLEQIIGWRPRTPVEAILDDVIASVKGELPSL